MYSWHQINKLGVSRIPADFEAVYPDFGVKENQISLVKTATIWGLWVVPAKSVSNITQALFLEKD